VDRLAALLTESPPPRSSSSAGPLPTADDVTRDAVSQALGIPLIWIPRSWRASKRDSSARSGHAAINRRHDCRGALVLDNVNGTAPGLWIEGRSSRLALLPGPPREMTPMLEALVRDRLAPLTRGGGLFRRVLKITGRAESEVDAIAQPIYRPATWPGGADRDHHPCGLWPSRVAPDGSRAESSRGRCGARPGGGSTGRWPRAIGVQHRRHDAQLLAISSRTRPWPRPSPAPAGS
jgi:molybdopterin-biosynthesis enzyme MoeA-like protein